MATALGDFPSCPMPGSHVASWALSSSSEGEGLGLAGMFLAFTLESSLSVCLNKASYFFFVQGQGT